MMRLSNILHLVFGAVIVCLLPACSQKLMDEARQRQREAQETQAAEDKTMIQTTKVGLTPESIKNCQAEIESVGGKGHFRLLTPLAVSTDAVRFIGNGVYGTFDKRTYESSPWTAVIAQCEYKNILSMTQTSYCGCAYQIKDNKLNFVRVLTPANFTKTVRY